MRISGEWYVGDDATARPIIWVDVVGRDGERISSRFLIDTGADRTVFNTALLRSLELPPATNGSGLRLVGIGGASAFVLVSTALELTRDDGGVAIVRGEFAAFTDPLAIDLSVLGRDVLDNFDLIVSRRRDEVLLLAPSHRYEVLRSP
jgi:hypothetical protein